MSDGTQSNAARAVGLSPARSYKPRVALLGKRGWYRVQSGTHPSVSYETSANSCTCPARKPCKHMRFVRRLNVAFYVTEGRAVPAAPATPTPAAALVAGFDAVLAAAEQRLAIKHRALADAHPQSDEYAVLLHAGDQAERAVAAIAASAMRAA